jgi:DNA repair exonuclease SbcCD nuclease subunit
MRRPIAEVRKLTIQHACPLVIAGDIFDRWNSPAELINFAIEEFGKGFENIYAIPGQHDLPGHNYEERYRSAYHSLELAGVIHNLTAPRLIGGAFVCAHPFPWGFPVHPCEPVGDLIHLAVVHAYVHQSGHSYPGADLKKTATVVLRSLEGYDAAVFGDNHSGFQRGILLNSGGFMRRKIDEIKYEPSVGLLYEDGSIERHFLDVSEDKFIEESRFLTIKEDECDFSEYIEELKEMGVSSLDFREELTRRMDKSGSCKAVREIISSLVE